MLIVSNLLNLDGISSSIMTAAVDTLDSLPYNITFVVDRWRQIYIAKNN